MVFMARLMRRIWKKEISVWEVNFILFFVEWINLKINIVMSVFMGLIRIFFYFRIVLMLWLSGIFCRIGVIMVGLVMIISVLNKKEIVQLSFIMQCVKRLVLMKVMSDFMVIIFRIVGLMLVIFFCFSVSLFLKRIILIVRDMKENRYLLGKILVVFFLFFMRSGFSSFLLLWVKKVEIGFIISLIRINGRIVGILVCQASYWVKMFKMMILVSLSMGVVQLVGCKNNLIL